MPRCLRRFSFIPMFKTTFLFVSIELCLGVHTCFRSR